MILYRAATAGAHYCYSPSTKNKGQNTAHTHTRTKNRKDHKKKTWNNWIQQLQEVSNWTLYNEPLLTRLCTSWVDLTTVTSLDSWQLMAMSWPQGLHGSWDRVSEVQSVASISQTKPWEKRSQHILYPWDSIVGVGERERDTIRHEGVHFFFALESSFTNIGRARWC